MVATLRFGTHLPDLYISFLQLPLFRKRLQKMTSTMRERMEAKLGNSNNNGFKTRKLFKMYDHTNTGRVSACRTAGVGRNSGWACTAAYHFSLRCRCGNSFVFKGSHPHLLPGCAPPHACCDARLTCRPGPPDSLSKYYLPWLSAVCVTRTTLHQALRAVSSMGRARDDAIVGRGCPLLCRVPCQDCAVPESYL